MSPRTRVEAALGELVKTAGSNFSRIGGALAAAAPGVPRRIGSPAAAGLTAKNPVRAGLDRQAMAPPKPRPGPISFGGNLAEMGAAPKSGGAATAAAAPVPGMDLAKALGGAGEGINAAANGLWRAAPKRTLAGVGAASTLAYFLKQFQDRAAGSEILQPNR